MCGDVRAAFRGTSSEGLDCETLFRLVSPSLFTGRAGPRGSSLAPAFCSFDWPLELEQVLHVQCIFELLDLLPLLSVSGDPQFWLASLPSFSFIAPFLLSFTSLFMASPLYLVHSGTNNRFKYAYARP